MRQIPPEPSALEDPGGVPRTPRSTRTGAPKVRTGCVTCKERHVKCDETKPACMKCLTIRGVCGGYFIKPRKNQSWKHRHIPTLADNSSQTYKTMIQPGVGISFEDDHQLMYFNEWRHLAQAPLSGYTSSKLWSTFMPQLTSQSIVLRHAALSIGAMSHALSAQPMGYHIVKNRHYQNAIEYYCKALRSLAQSSHQSVKLVDAVLLSILFATFEGLCRNLKSALEHVSHGISMIRTLCSGPDALLLLDQLAPDPGELVSEVVSLYSRLGVQAQIVVGGCIEASNSKTKGSMETPKATPQEMRKIDLRLSRYFNPHKGLTSCPETFTSSQEARDYWVAMTRRVENMGPDVVRVLGNLLDEDATNYSAVTEAIRRFQSSFELKAYTINARSQLEQWYRAFSPLYQRRVACSNISETSDGSLMSLYVEYLAMSIHSNVAMCGDYEYVKSITSKCREINHLCEILLRQHSMGLRRPACIFTMHTGLSWHLIFVAINCRDPDVRESAMRVLETYPRHDGLWSSHLLLAVARKNQVIELENSAEGSPEVQWQRLCRRVYLFEEAGGMLIFRFMSKDKESGHWEFIEEYAEASQLTADARELQWKPRPLSSQRLTLQWGRTADATSGTLWPGMGCRRQLSHS